MNNGLIHLESKHSVDETTQRLQLLLQEKSIMIFALVDHSSEAARSALRCGQRSCLSSAVPKAGRR